eukprot:8653991-Lingulodinium_polyedra.AAC.1
MALLCGAQCQNERSGPDVVQVGCRPLCWRPHPDCGIFRRGLRPGQSPRVAGTSCCWDFRVDA